MITRQLLIILTTAVSAQAATMFVGQTITAGHYVPDQSTVNGSTLNSTVVDGTSDLFTLSPFANQNPGYTVDIDQDSLLITFVNAVNFTAGPTFHGIIIQNLVSPDTAVLSNSSGFNSFSYDGSTLRLNWQNVSVPNGATYNITFVPEPTSTMLASIGVLAYLSRRRR